MPIAINEVDGNELVYGQQSAMIAAHYIGV